MEEINQAKLFRRSNEQFFKTFINADAFCSDDVLYLKNV